MDDDMRMRKLAILLVVFPSLALAQAKKKTAKADSKLTYVDDEPMAPSAAHSRRNDPNGMSGRRMDATIQAPEVGKVAVTGETVARVPTADVPPARDEGSAAGDALDELVAKQMRKNQASIDACAAAAVHRHPTANGTIALAVVVAEKKVKSVHVTTDTVHDVELDACLVKAGLAWKLQLASARFTWPVTLSPSASR
jgi:hypothetical protein